MATDPNNAFVDNWTYLKSELNWLERVLMVAVSRQRKESKEIDRIAQSKADRASSHWWKGVISTEGQGVYDDQRKPHPAAKPPQSYSQQLERRIQSSYQQGIPLGLPLLRDRLQLTPFEKNLVLLSLAPEVNRRYSRLYRFLQSEDGKPSSDLPTVDLALRLLCKDDREWQTARARLFSESPLIRYQVLSLLTRPFEPSLSRGLRLSDPAIAYLLSEAPTAEHLEALLMSVQASRRPLPLVTETIPVDWSDLLLPAELLVALQAIAHPPLPPALSGGAEPSEINTARLADSVADPATDQPVFVLAGPRGTGKTLAAQAIAHARQAPLQRLDLSSLDPVDFLPTLQALTAQPAAVLLIQSAEHWLRRSALLPASELHRFLRNRPAGLTLFSVTLQEAIALTWRPHLNGVLRFPRPSLRERLQFWQRAIPPSLPGAADLNWQQIAQSPLTGGEIGAIAATTLRLWQSSGAEKLGRSHLQQAFKQHGRG